MDMMRKGYLKLLLITTYESIIISVKRGEWQKRDSAVP